MQRGGNAMKKLFATLVIIFSCISFSSCNLIPNVEAQNGYGPLNNGGAMHIDGASMAYRFYDARNVCYVAQSSAGISIYCVSTR